MRVSRTYTLEPKAQVWISLYRLDLDRLDLDLVLDRLDLR
jgi:hypothetical protein